MNVNDVDKVKEYPQDILGAIFARQMDLMGKYHDIEKKNGLLQTEMMPFNLHDRFCQARIKDFLWRTTEELAESLEVIMYPSDEFDESHIVEEIIDALHFFTELCISCNLSSVEIRDGHTLNELEEILTYNQLLDADRPEEQQKMLFLDVIVGLGLCGNCLKNKPWKQDHKMTDVEKFRGMLIKTYHSLLKLMFVGFDMTPEDVFDMYFRKNQVNKFRQRSGY